MVGIALSQDWLHLIVMRAEGNAQFKAKKWSTAIRCDSIADQELHWGTGDLWGWTGRITGSWVWPKQLLSSSYSPPLRHLLTFPGFTHCILDQTRPRRFNNLYFFSTHFLRKTVLTLKHSSVSCAIRTAGHNISRVLAKFILESEWGIIIMELLLDNMWWENALELEEGSEERTLECSTIGGHPTPRVN